MLKKVLACLLAASLVWTEGAPLCSWAAENKPASPAPVSNPREALAYLRQKGVIKSNNDPLLSYVIDAKTAS